jgi:AcrR family transcriptional regulator
MCTYSRTVPSRLQEARADETRLGLLRAARELFTLHGYAGTSTEQLVQRAGVTRGALYHHFDSKRALFEAVLIELEEEFEETARRVASPRASAWKNLVAGCHAFLDTCLRPDIQQIVLLDGLAVLGQQRWREIEDQYALAPLVAGLTGAIDDEVLPPRPVVPLARLLLAAINEAGLLIAEAERPTSARRDAGEAFDALLDGLRARPD